MGLKPAVNTKLGPADLHGCLLVIQAHSVKERRSKIPGSTNGTYPVIVCTVAVLAGEPGETVVEEFGRDLPLILEDFEFDKAAITDKLASKAGKFDDDGTPKLTATVIGTYTDTYGNKGRFCMDEPTEEGFALAGRFVESTLGKSTFPERDPFGDDTRAGKAFA